MIIKFIVTSICVLTGSRLGKVIARDVVKSHYLKNNSAGMGEFPDCVYHRAEDQEYYPHCNTSNPEIFLQKINESSQSADHSILVTEIIGALAGLSIAYALLTSMDKKPKKSINRINFERFPWSTQGKQSERLLEDLEDEECNAWAPV